MDHHHLESVARLLTARNALDAELATLMNRPMTAGHLGEWIAAQIFVVDLEPAANHRGADGVFAGGPLRGRSVNVKWYLEQEGILDIPASEELDDILVLAGPRAPAARSEGSTRPWCIDAVYLFDARRLRATLSERGAKIGTATGVRAEQWRTAEIYPRAGNDRLRIDDDQRRALGRFTSAATAPGQPDG